MYGGSELVSRPRKKWIDSVNEYLKKRVLNVECKKKLNKSTTEGAIDHGKGNVVDGSIKIQLHCNVEF